eukprot:403363311
MNLFSSKKSLSDAILNYRKPNTNHKQYLNMLLAETKQELTTKDFGDKAVAAQKLLFLFNEGIDISWAIFNIIELMGSSTFENKRIAYVLAPLVLRDGQNSEFLTLTPNIFRKDFKDMGQDPFTVSISVNCLARICDQDLASILYKEMIPLYTCSKALIRRKICILTYKMFYFCTDSIPELLPYLSDRLKDTKVGVQISAVTTIHEISRMNPKLFLVTIPHLYELISSTKSNWLIIKLIKLFMEFIPIEPRLFIKLRPKFREMLLNQKAKSVEYELIKAVIQNFKAPEDIELVALAKDKLAYFLNSNDPNLKYLGLITLKEILEKDKSQIQQYKPYIVQCFNSADPSIKNRALEIIKVTRNVLTTIGDICTINNYQNVTNFEWLACTVLPCLAKNISDLINSNNQENTTKSNQESNSIRQESDLKFERKLGDILIDVAIKVEDIRQRSIVKKCYEIATDSNQAKELMYTQRDMYQSHFIQCVFFILSEYQHELDFSDQQKFQICKDLLDSDYLSKKVVESLRLQVLNIVFKAALKNQDTSLDYASLLNQLNPTGFESFVLKDQISLYQNILKFKAKPSLSQESSDILKEIIDDELSQFNEQAQLAVPIPECLDEKFMVSKKEVQVQEKFIIGNQQMSIQKQKTVKQEVSQFTNGVSQNASKILTPKLMLESYDEEEKLE